MLDRSVRRLNRFVVGALFLLLGLGGNWLYNSFLLPNLALLNSEEAVMAVASFLPLGIFVFLLFGLLGVGDVMHQLYLAPDLELLMVAPVPYRSILAVKLLQSSRALLIPALGFAAFLLALGLARQAGAAYSVLVVLLLLAAMLLVAALIMILVILLARWVPARRTRTWIPVALALLMFSLVLIQQPFTEWLFERASWVAFLTEALLNPAQLGMLVAGLGGLALVTGLAAYWLFHTSFREGWNRFHQS